MPVKWTPEMEREMLLIAIGDLKPSASTWQIVADQLGQGLNASAVRYVVATSHPGYLPDT